MFTLPNLPFDKSSLVPFISAETIDFHYGKHHKAYVDKLNLLIEGTSYQKMTLEEIIKTSNGPIFNNAAQVWNHTFYWNCLINNSDKAPVGKMLFMIEDSFESFEKFKTEFVNSALNNFGSGWTWLVQGLDGDLKIINTSNADTIITTSDTPLLVIDVWEHAYYIDVRNERLKYIENFFHVINWNFVMKNIK